MEKPKDRDFIETFEGLLFCVVGYLHPPDSYTAYLKYVPDPEGRWGKGANRYSRAIPFYHVSQVEETYALLRERYPHYLFICPVRNITISSVPRTKVKTYHHPRSRLQTLHAKRCRDTLEEKLIDIVGVLVDISGLRYGDFGVTGSLLTGIHSPDFSDIDLTVYGLKTSHDLKEALIEARDKNGDIMPLSRERMEEWSLSRSDRFPLSFRELMGIAVRRWNYGLYGDTYFSVHPVRTDGEVTERYGDRVYHQLGDASGIAEITDSREAIYLPAIYHVENAELEADVNAEVKQVVSYEGLFCGIFEEGERIKFSGILEESRACASKEVHCRVVVGGAGSEGGYVKPAA